MSLLQFDPSGALDPDFGLTASQWNEGLETLQSLRHDLLAAGGLLAESGFYGLPIEQLEAYESQREQSELGRVFALANGMHDRLDAVVVLGVGGSSLGGRAMMEACCHPYHNELSRGARGSKPRMYFAGDHLDNDVSSALLHRLALGSCEYNQVASRWGLCVVSKSGERLETAVAVRQFLAALEQTMPGRPGDSLAEFVFPVTGPSGKLYDLVQQLGCQPILAVPPRVESRFSVLSPVGLLPAAFLGLDCMQLLVGAMAMNKHFETAAVEDNVVLQFVAANHLLARHRRGDVRVMSVWSHALTSIGQWYEQLLSESAAGCSAGVLPLTMTNPRDLHSRRPNRPGGGPNPVFNNLIVDRFRTDPLAVGSHGGNQNQDGLDDLADKSIPQLGAAAIRGANDAWHAAGHPTTDLILPTIDTHVLGQLFQLLMIATVVEMHWQGQNPFGPSGSAPYITNTHKHLGRT
ncbi:hypothetical protein [Roseimaritima ulvae]|uniref:hypothetical protein n=1 Tax=Roseimaritima ulvae TaxID=980254 RepID=UPI000831FF7D|nr:hypothetical protein [Roseimaritima ulvae]